MICDAHPEIGCPAEAGLPALMSHMADAWMTVEADVLAVHRNEDPGAVARDRETDGTIRPPTDDQDGQRAAPFADLPPDARDWIRKTIRVPMRRFLGRDGKRVYVDKSLDSVFHLELVQALYPAARYVLLYRHVMDTVASGLEASPWGFHAYGYAPYVQASPHNTVAALANYWLAHVTTALDWEEKHSDQCHRVRYDDLVVRPEEIVRALQNFLGVREDVSVLQRMFDGQLARGPGDYKVGHTKGVHARSIEHGKRVPVAMLPPPLLDELNEKLVLLGYKKLGRSWNAQERSVDGPDESLWAERLRDMMTDVRIVPGAASSAGPRSVAVVAEDHRSLRWVLNLQSLDVQQGDGEVEAVLTGTAEDLVLMLTGEENVGVLLRTGRIRHLAASEEETPVDLPGMLNRLLSALGC